MSPTHLYAAHERFDASADDKWTSYIQWSGFHHISELVSTDTMLCPSVIHELVAADWSYNVHADFKTLLFHDFSYLKCRIHYDPSRHNLLALFERPSSPTGAPTAFELCGYDILDSDNSVSVLTNCGGYPAIFSPAEVNRYGLLGDLGRAVEIAAAIRASAPEDHHCRDCRV